MGGVGFKPKVWSLTPINVKSMLILNDIEMNTSSSEQSIIINDDYNQTNEIKLSNITVTVIKMREKEKKVNLLILLLFQKISKLKKEKTDLNSDISNVWTNTSQQKITIKEKHNRHNKQKSDEYYENNFASNDE